MIDLCERWLSRRGLEGSGNWNRKWHGPMIQAEARVIMSVIFRGRLRYCPVIKSGDAFEAAKTVSGRPRGKKCVSAILSTSSNLYSEWESNFTDVWIRKTGFWRFWFMRTVTLESGRQTYNNYGPSRGRDSRDGLPERQKKIGNEVLFRTKILRNGNEILWKTPCTRQWYYWKRHKRGFYFHSPLPFRRKASLFAHKGNNFPIKPQITLNS